MLKVKFFENNGGMVYAAVFQDDVVTNVISGFEDEMLSAEKLIVLVKEGFPYSDPFDPEQWSGFSMEEAEKGMEDGTISLVAEIVHDEIELFPERMGTAAKILFGEEEEVS